MAPPAARCWKVWPLGNFHGTLDIDDDEDRDAVPRKKKHGPAPSRDRGSQW